jgi:hypothetical protein
MFDWGYAPAEHPLAGLIPGEYRRTEFRRLSGGSRHPGQDPGHDENEDAMNIT